MPDQNSQPCFNIQRIYLKDLSLEQPNSPAIFLETEIPSIEVEANVDAQALAEGFFECVVMVTITASIKEKRKVAFLIEAKQAGVFEIRNIAPEQIKPLLEITCPTVIFPYLRANIADVMTRAGFPPLHLAEINFQALYEQRCAQDAKPSNGAGVSSAE